MNIYRIKIGDLVFYKGEDNDYGIGLVMNTATNGLTRQRHVRVMFKDRDHWFPAFSLKKVTT